MKCTYEGVPRLFVRVIRGAQKSQELVDEVVPFAGHEQLVDPEEQRVHVEHEDEDEPAPQEHVHLLEDEVDWQRAVPVDAIKGHKVT